MNYGINCIVNGHSHKLISQVCLDSQNNKKLFCVRCNMSNLKKTVNLKYFNSKIDEFLNNHSCLKVKLKNMKEKVNYYLDSLNVKLEEKVNLINKQREQLIKEHKFENLQELCQTMSNEIIFDNELVDQFKISIQEEIISSEKSFDLINVPEISPFIKKMQFNNTNELLICGSDKIYNNTNSYLQIFKINKDGLYLDLVDKPEGHSNVITSLCFCKKDNSFFSGDQNSTIIFWTQNLDQNCWTLKQRLQAHQSPISHLSINKEDDFLISGDDNTIILWNLQQNEWKNTQIFSYQSHIFSLSINNDSNKLVVALQNQFVIIQQNQEGIWNQDQQIQFPQQQQVLFSQFFQNNIYLVHSRISKTQKQDQKIFTIYILNNKNELLQVLPLNIGEENYTSQFLLFSSQTEIIICVNEEYITMYNIQNYQMQEFYKFPIKGEVQELALTSNGKLIAYALNNKINLEILN